MDDGEIGMLDDTDKKILSASIMGVDITEIFSPESRPSGEKVWSSLRVFDGSDQWLGF